MHISYCLQAIFTFYSYSLFFIFTCLLGHRMIVLKNMNSDTANEKENRTNV